MKAAIFDMDGTLVDSMYYWRTVAIEYLRGQGFEPDEELRAQIYTMSVRRTPDLMRRHFAIPHTDAELNPMFDRLMESHYLHDVNFKPGAYDYVRSLIDRGVTCILATASTRSQVNTLLGRIGGLELFVREGQDYVVCSDEIGMSKGSEAYYPTVCARFGLQPGECVMFEDALYSMRTAKRAGLKVWAIEDDTALLQREEIKSLADRYFLNWSDLME